VSHAPFITASAGFAVWERMNGKRLAALFDVVVCWGEKSN
jgi:hypothetical protein